MRKYNKTFTKKDHKRYVTIVKELSRLSAKGWDRATHVDYEPLEKELADLGNRMIEAQS